MTIKRIMAVAVAALTLCGTAIGQYATITGSLNSSNGMPASNYIISFQISQMGFVAGSGVVVNVGTYCATSTDGSVVGVPNPLAAPSVPTGFTGTLPPNNYFVKIAYYDAAGNVTLVSPERQIQLVSTGRLIVASTVGGMPAGAVGMRVYISLSTNTETLQGSSTGSASYIQSVPLVTGAAVPSSNTTLCKQIANDAIWPTGTGYTVALTDPSGNTIPGYPMQWQLMGPNTTINLSTGLPYYHGTVYFPTPILASPLNHALQSISGPVSLSGYNLTNVGAIGVGTTLPAWPIDVENGVINSSGGYLFNGSGGTAGQCLISDGTAYDTPATCITTANAAYQVIDTNGTPVTPRPVLNFSSRFALSDSASPARTTVDLASTITAGSCTSCNLSYDAFGRLTAAANGSGAPITRTYHVVTSSRVFGTNYANPSTTEMLVSGNGSEIGSGTGTMTCTVGPSNPATQQVWGLIYTATVDLAPAGFACTVPIGYWYRLDITGNIHPISFGGGANWLEYY